MSALSTALSKQKFNSAKVVLGPVTFRLPDGKVVQPLHVAPWENEDICHEPPLLQRLRGEWPCVPFGMRPSEILPDRWRADDDAMQEDVAGVHAHGFGSNHHWQVSVADDLTLLAKIDYPERSAVAHLERRITATSGKPELTFELAITVRENCCLPIGLHPVFALPGQPGTMRLDPGSYCSVWTHPIDEGPGRSLFEPDRVFADLTNAPVRDGSLIDACALPYEGSSENLLLLTNASGAVGLIHTVEGYRTDLEWDAQMFPSLMLWISNRGRTDSPWNGRHLAIGIEPVLAAFDLGENVSKGSNPLAGAGVPTARHFWAGETLLTKYVIRLSQNR